MPLQQISVSPLDWGKESTNTTNQNQDWKIQEPVFTTSGQNPPERCASRASTLSNNHDICRICHCEGDSEVPLTAPCYCAGSLRYVHQACLQQWIKSSDIRSCELCKFQFIMQSKIKPFGEWEKLEMSGVERRKLSCSVLFHFVALTCVVWSLYVLIERTAYEIRQGNIEWPLWTKIIVVAIGFTGGIVFMYIQCKAYVHLCRRWKAFNRVIFVQNAPEKVHLPPADPPPPREEMLLLASDTCCGVVVLPPNEDPRHRAKLASAVEDAPTRINLDPIFQEKVASQAEPVVEMCHTQLGPTHGEGKATEQQEAKLAGDAKPARKFSYGEGSCDCFLQGPEWEERSRLLQKDPTETRGHAKVVPAAGGFVLIQPGADPLETSCGVISTSSSEESLQSPSVQLLQTRKQVSVQTRPWTGGSGNWTTAPGEPPTQSLGSQSPLLSIAAVQLDTVGSK